MPPYVTFPCVVRVSIFVPSILRLAVVFELFRTKSSPEFVPLLTAPMIEFASLLLRISTTEFEVVKVEPSARNEFALKITLPSVILLFLNREPPDSTVVFPPV